MLPLVPAGLDGRLGAALGVELSVCLPVAPELPLAPLEPDGLELPDAELAPPDAARSPSRSHPAIREPLSATATAAANAVNFILTSMGLCAPQESN